MTGKSLPLAQEKPTETQRDTIASIVDDGISKMLGRVESDGALQTLDMGPRIYGLFKYAVQAIVRTMVNDLGLPKAKVREWVTDWLNEELKG